MFTSERHAGNQACMSVLEQALHDLKQGKMIILKDDPSRENEGDLMMIAAHVRPQDLNFMLKYARGLLCVALSHEQVSRLRLPPMVQEKENQSTHLTPFLVSVDAAQGIGSGVSVSDRAVTIKKLADPNSKRADFLIPGHVQPLCAHQEGLLKRHGHTEASVRLAQLAGDHQAAILCEILNDEGEAASSQELAEFASIHGLKILHISDLIS